MKFRNYSVFVVLTLFMFSGCSQVMRTNFVEHEIKDVKIIYDIPKAMLKGKSIREMFNFNRYCRRNESLSINTNNDLWIIEKTITDTGAGITGTPQSSGIIYEIKVTHKDTDKGVKVTFSVVKVRSYQGGIIVKTPIPKLDIKQFLSSAYFNYCFELNSKYDKESVKGNFDRLLNKHGSDTNIVMQKYNNNYYFKTDLATYSSNVGFFPYRGGSKIIVDSKIQLTASRNQKGNVITLHHVVADLKKKMNKVLNA